MWSAYWTAFATQISQCRLVSLVHRSFERLRVRKLDTLLLYNRSPLGAGYLFFCSRIKQNGWAPIAAVHKWMEQKETLKDLRVKTEGLRQGAWARPQIESKSPEGEDASNRILYSARSRGNLHSTAAAIVANRKEGLYKRTQNLSFLNTEVLSSQDSNFRSPVCLYSLLEPVEALYHFHFVSLLPPFTLFLFCCGSACSPLLLPQRHHCSHWEGVSQPQKPKTETRYVTTNEYCSNGYSWQTAITRVNWLDPILPNTWASPLYPFTPCPDILFYCWLELTILSTDPSH